MYQVLLVDDDMTNRLGIKSLLNWNELGFEVIGSVENGKEALEFIENHTVHLMITDMKMPLVDGVELIREVRKYDNQMRIIAISSYGDFGIVREAFKHDIVDYIMKTDLTDVELQKLVISVKEKLLKQNIDSQETEKQYFREVVLGKKEDSLKFFSNYYIFMISFKNIIALQKRFQPETDIMGTIQEIISMIPRIANDSYCMEYKGAGVLLCYKSVKMEEQKLHALAQQIMRVINNYISIDAYISASDWIGEEPKLEQAINQATKRIAMRYIFGKDKIFITDYNGIFNLEEALCNENHYQEVIQGLQIADADVCASKLRKLLNSTMNADIQIIRKKCLELLYFEGLFLETIGDSIFDVWGMNVDYYSKLERLDESSTIFIWMFNYNRGLIDYLFEKYSKELDKIDKDSDMTVVQHYIEDNYIKSDLSLAEVSSIVNLSTKYLSVKFKKELGLSFKEYLTKVRMDAAKTLLNETNMKIEEISSAVGYNNMEHFTRVFKKLNDVSPREYGKKFNE